MNLGGTLLDESEIEFDLFERIIPVLAQLVYLLIGEGILLPLAEGENRRRQTHARQREEEPQSVFLARHLGLLRSWGPSPDGRGNLLLEYFHHQLVLHLIEILQRRVQRLAFVVGTRLEDVFQAKRSTLHQQFGIFQLLAVHGDIEAYFLGVSLDQLERRRCIPRLAGGVLASRQFGHLVNQFGIEKTLILRLGLISLYLERRNGRGIEHFVVDSPGAQEGLGQGGWIEAQKLTAMATNRISHLAESERYVLRYRLRTSAASLSTGLPFLIGKLTRGSCQKLAVCLLGSLIVMELIVRSGPAGNS